MGFYFNAGYIYCDSRGSRSFGCWKWYLDFSRELFPLAARNMLHQYITEQLLRSLEILVDKYTNFNKISILHTSNAIWEPISLISTINL